MIGIKTMETRLTEMEVVTSEIHTGSMKMVPLYAFVYAQL